MPRYARTSPKFWQDPMVRRWDDRQKLLAQYLMTCPARTTEGLFWLPKAYASIDLGWSIDGVSKTLRSLCDAGFAEYDDASETVLIRKALKYQAPAGDKQITGAINTLADVPPSPLFSLLRDAAMQFAPDFGKALDEALTCGPLADHVRPFDTPSEGYPPSSSNSSSNSSSETPPPQPDDEGFDEFWDVYPKRNGRKEGKAATLVEWRKLSMPERRRAYVGAKHLAASGELPKDPERFLRRDKAGEFLFDRWQQPPSNVAQLRANDSFADLDRHDPSAWSRNGGAA